MTIFRRSAQPDRTIAQSDAASLVRLGTDYLPRAFVDWAQEYAWLLDEICGRWLRTGESPKRADLQQALMADGRDVYVAGVLHDMPRPLGWTEPQDQRVVLSLFGLRLTPAAQELLEGLGPLVALAVARYRESGSGGILSVGDVERGFAIRGQGAAALKERLFTELPFVGQEVPPGRAEDGEAHEIWEDVARYAGIRTTDEYLQLRAEEIRWHPQFGWGTWEPERIAPALAAAGSAVVAGKPVESLTRRLFNHPWVVGIGTVVVGGVILALVLGHG
jgi:hypothetical protein